MHQFRRKKEGTRGGLASEQGSWASAALVSVPTGGWYSRTPVTHAPAEKSALPVHEEIRDQQPEKSS